MYSVHIHIHVQCICTVCTGRERASGRNKRRKRASGISVGDYTKDTDSKRKCEVCEAADAYTINSINNNIKLS